MAILKMPFGRHKGQAITNIPREYLAWAYEAMTRLTPSQRQEIKALLDKYASMERQRR